MGALNFAQMTFSEIVSQLTQDLRLKETWKETAAAGTGQTLIELFANVGSALTFQIERAVEEWSREHAQLRSSVFHQAKRVAYSPARKASARCTLCFSLPSDYWTGHTYTVVIPRHTQVSSADGRRFLTIEEKRLSSPSVQVDVQALEGTESTTTQAADGSSSQAVTIPIGGEEVEAVENSSVRVTVGATVWTEVDTLATLESTDQSYMVERKLSALEIQFGDGVHGAIPTAGLDIVVEWVVTSGTDGNLYVLDSLTTVDDTIYDTNSNDVSSDVSGTNTTSATGGADEETLEEIRDNYPRNVGASYGVGHTDDYTAKLLAYPGVLKALVWGETETLGGAVSNPDMAWQVKAVLMPTGGGTFSAAQKTLIQDYVDARKVLGCRFSIEDPVYSYVDFVVDAMRLSTYETTSVSSAIEAAIEALFVESVINFGQELRESDVIATIDAVDGVDYHETEIFLAEDNEAHVTWVGDGSTVLFSGTLGISPVAPGTVRVCLESVAGSIREYGRDNGTPVNRVGTLSGVSGTVRYDDGAISVTFAAAPATGEKVRVRYRPALPTSTTIGTGDGTTMSFSGFIPAHAVPQSVQLTVGGTAQASDDGFGSWDDADVSGSIDYKTGYVTIVLSAAPALAADVVVVASCETGDMDLPYYQLPSEGKHNISVEAP